MNAQEIERARRRAMNSNLTHEVIEVEIIKTSFGRRTLKFNIDDRLVREWVRRLLVYGDEFKMTNKQTGVMLWSKTLQGDLEKIAQTMVSQ